MRLMQEKNERLYGILSRKFKNSSLRVYFKNC